MMRVNQMIVEASYSGHQGREVVSGYERNCERKGKFNEDVRRGYG